ncbi:MAG: ArnT family glycosyltransferase [Microgenomates group bacterium]
MFSIKMFKKHLTTIVLFFISFLSLTLFLYKLTSSPPCLNADEATNAYDAYSILKTGRDQYGNFLPLRFKSFGDYKLPLLTYLAIPFIKIFGLNELGIRMVNLPFVFLFPIVVFLLTRQLFGKNSFSVIAAFLTAFAPGLQLIGRQAHEGYMTAFFLTLAFYLFLRFFKKQNFLNYLLFTICYLLFLFGYHSSRLWGGFFILLFIYFIVKNKLKWFYILGLIAALILFSFTDLFNSQTRIKNLLFFNNIGFTLKINELRAEGGSRFFYNKLTVGAKEVISQYLNYFSPQFLVNNGDENYRFGFPGVSPITPIEYIFLFIGLYYLFKNKEKWRYLILLMLLFSPITGALSWAGLSITRTVFIFIPIVIITSYGLINFTKNRQLLFLLFVICYLLFLFYSWDFYLNHYPKRAIVLRSWQAGYKELVSYIKKNYSQFDRFYITRKNGQPYIFLLFYLAYPPEKYQKIAKLTPPDEYGFGQVTHFDKFYFNFIFDPKLKKTVFVGYPEDFKDLTVKLDKIKKIKIATEEIFWIYEIN